MWLAAAMGSAILFGLAGWWMKSISNAGGSTGGCFLVYLLRNNRIRGPCDALEQLWPILQMLNVWIAGIIIGVVRTWEIRYL